MDISYYIIGQSSDFIYITKKNFLRFIKESIDYVSPHLSIIESDLIITIANNYITYKIYVKRINKINELKEYLDNEIIKTSKDFCIGRVVDGEDVPLFINFLENLESNIFNFINKQKSARN